MELLLTHSLYCACTGKLYSYPILEMQLRTVTRQICDWKVMPTETKTGLEKLNEPDSNCNYNRPSSSPFCIDVLFCLGVENDEDRNQAYVWRVIGTAGTKYRSGERRPNPSQMDLCKCISIYYFRACCIMVLLLCVLNQSS